MKSVVFCLNGVIKHIPQEMQLLLDQSIVGHSDFNKLDTSGEKIERFFVVAKYKKVKPMTR